MIPYIIALFIAAQPLNSADIDKNEIVAKVESRFAAMKNFKARFSQKLYNTALGETEQSAGLVAMQKPLKMAWEYHEPQKQTIISDGEFLFFYVPADRQVVVEHIGKVLTSRSPALFLAGNRKLSDIFRIELETAANEAKIKNEVELTLFPKEKSLTVTRIILRVSREDFIVSSFTLFDWTGNRTDIEFTEMKVNGKLNEKRFVFEKPEGVEMIEMPKFDFGTE